MWRGALSALSPETFDIVTHSVALEMQTPGSRVCAAVCVGFCNGSPP